MIANVSLFKLKPGTTEEQLEDMMSRTRVQLLRVPEILVVRTGKRVSENEPWHWFLLMEVESLDKLAIAQDDPYYIKFRQEVVRPFVEEESVQSYEMEPRKNTKYS